MLEIFFPLAMGENLTTIPTALAATDTATTLQNMALAITAFVTAIGGIIGLATKFYTDNIRHGKVEDREAKVIEVLNDISNSLEATDQGAKDNAQLLAQLTNMAASVPTLKEFLDKNKGLIDDITKNANEWSEDIKKYYEERGSTAGDQSSDRNIRSLAQIQKKFVKG